MNSIKSANGTHKEKEEHTSKQRLSLGVITKLKEHPSKQVLIPRGENSPPLKSIIDNELRGTSGRG